MPFPAADPAARPWVTSHPLLKPSGNTALAAATEGAAMGKALLVLVLQRAGSNILLIGKQAPDRNGFLREHEGALR